MVNDLGDRHFLRTGDGLGHFIMVHQNEPSARGFQHVGLGEDALKAAGVTYNHVGRDVGRREFLAQVGEALIGGKGGELSVD